MKSLLKSWKTSIIGLSLIGGAIYLFVKGHEGHGSACLAVGLGMLAAKDGDKTGKP